jgi:hypothetical protein
MARLYKILLSLPRKNNVTMRVKCEFCGAMIEEANDNCPNCGAPLSGANRTANEQPKTIEELKEWYIAHHLPPEEITRFFIGKNITEPKAFGIYKDGNGDFVVYKNKANGERAIRYQGSDEQYAVNELYQRLKAEIADQKGNSQPRTTQPVADKKKSKKKGCLIVIIVMFIIGILMAIFDNSAPNGYYNYNGTEYYHQGSSWYYYDQDSDDWYKSNNEIDITDKNADDYRTYHQSGKSFEETSWYDSGSHSDNSSWDSDSDWDSGNDSWDSGGTDWDSDW